ncbi:NINE protein [Kovacikia minuta CCNUW1]|uniref:NINE protein n=1 Tax=Kovacikia minuta TaxID=2931930 RepID=UPI001CC92EE0|nr:NINE protein [Kovacikia minuta]UBF25741.1 NINE protein [Kovacikia minuta CCNUW1]
MKSRTTAGLLALFLGGLGVHKFYLGEGGKGVLYLVFFWTYVPAIIALVEAIILFSMSDTDFNAKYNNGAGLPVGKVGSAKDTTSALIDLKKLYEAGVITAEEFEEKRKNLLKTL